MEKLRTPSGIGEAAPSLQARRQVEKVTATKSTALSLTPNCRRRSRAARRARVPSMIFHTLELFPMNLQLAPRNISSAAFFTIIFLHR